MRLSLLKCIVAVAALSALRGTQSPAVHLSDVLDVAGWRVHPESGRRCAVVQRLRRPVAEAPWPPLPSGALPDSQVRSWLLSPVYERVHSGQGAFLAELRPTVALFLSFAGIDYDEDE